MNNKVSDTGRTERTAQGTVLVALVFLVALNLRPALTTLGPLLPQIGVDEGIDESVQGLLGSLPLLAFAVVSPFVHHLSRRFGMERSILVALTLLALGVVIRSFTGTGGLWVGTAITGSAIAVGNVLVPTLVKRDYSTQVSRATGIYSACITIGASVASAIAVPLSDLIGWRGALAFWAIPALVVALIWIPRVRVAPSVREISGSGGDVAFPSVWRQPTAWLVTAFMGVQSTAFYVMVTWLPTIEIAAGMSQHEAGWHLFIYQIVGIAGTLLIPLLMRGSRHQVAAALTASVPIFVGVLGLLLFPQLGLLWVIVAGLGSGAALVVALSLISLRGRTQQETTQLSGMAQSLGYLFAALGPVLAGFLAQQTGSWTATLVAFAVLTGVQVLVCFPAGRTPKTREGI
ncbi:MAG: MFS transporter [Ancrocorticia sp.]